MGYARSFTILQTPELTEEWDPIDLATGAISLQDLDISPTGVQCMLFQEKPKEPRKPSSILYLEIVLINKRSASNT